MKQFDVFENPIIKGRKAYPFVCCLQNELLQGLSTRVVAFVTSNTSFAFDKVSIPVEIDGQKCFICMNVVATIERNRLVHFVDNVSGSRSDIVNAYDAVLMGI
jgi:hypothetical protein